MHWLDWTLLLLLVIAIIRGYRSGFISQAISLGSLVLAWLLADPASKVLIDLLANQGVTMAMGWFTWLLSFVIVQFIARLLLRIFLKGVGAMLGALNRVAGAILSLLVTAMMLVALLNCYTALSPRYGWGEIPKESTIAPELIKIGETILPTRLLIQKGVEDHLTPKVEPTAEPVPTDTII